MVLASQPLPASRLLSSGMPCGWMNRGTPSSSALAQTGWNFGSEKSTPFTEPPIAAPFRPCFFTAVSSSCTARSGACKVSEAKAAKRSGFEAQSSASFSFWILTICAGEIALAVVPERIDRQHLHVDGLRVHRGEPLVELDEGLVRALDRADLKLGAVVAEQRAGFAEMAMGVHVDGLDPLAVDHHGQFLPRRLLARARCATDRSRKRRCRWRQQRCRLSENHGVWS